MVRIMKSVLPPSNSVLPPDCIITALASPPLGNSWTIRPTPAVFRKPLSAPSSTMAVPSVSLCRPLRLKRVDPELKEAPALVFWVLKLPAPASTQPLWPYSGSRVNAWITPPTASAPYNALRGPRTISTRSTSSVGKYCQGAPPLVADRRRTPSTRNTVESLVVPRV